MERDVHFVNDSWCFVKFSVNMNNFTISYTREGGFKSKEAADSAKKLADEQYESDLKRIKEIANIQYTFREYVEYWLKNIFLPTTDTVTKVIGVWAVNNLILPNVRQDVLLNYISADYVNDIIKRCIPVCESAGETVVKFLRKMLFDAYSYGLISSDIREELTIVKRKVPHLQLLNKEELKKLLQEASKHPGSYFEILLALFVGLRSGEIRGLRYEDFDPDRCTIRIARQYTANYTLADCNDHYDYTCYMEEKSPKKDSYRLLQVPSFIFDELEKKRLFNEKIIQNRRAAGDKDLDIDYISISPYGIRRGKSALLTVLKRICNHASIPEISVHGLRHQFATLLIEKGVPLEEISKLLGHKSVVTTFNIYCGIMDADNDTRKVVGRLFPYSEGNEV